MENENNCLDCGKKIRKGAFRCSKCGILFKNRKGKLCASCNTPILSTSTNCLPCTLKLLHKRTHLWAYKTGKSSGKHLCSCGNKIVKYSATRCLSCSRERLSIPENTANWQGGLSYQEYGIEFTPKLRRSIRERDGFICRECGISNEEHKFKFKQSLAVHHIDYNKKNNNPINLITLCISCHAKTNYNRDEWKAHFMRLERHNAGV